MKLNLKLNKFDFINVGGVAAAVVGFILAIIGSAVLSKPEGIGVNFNLSPLVWVGVAVLAAGLAATIVGNVFYKTRDMNRIVASASLYVAVIALMVIIVVIALTIVMPVINPSNG